MTVASLMKHSMKQFTFLAVFSVLFSILTAASTVLSESAVEEIPKGAPTVFGSCPAKRAGHRAAIELATAKRVGTDTVAAHQVATCQEQTMIFFDEAGKYVQKCCGTSSTTGVAGYQVVEDENDCTGCQQVTSKRCSKCLPGYYIQGVHPFKRCVRCDDMMWVDKDGLTCENYQREGICIDGVMTNTTKDVPFEGLKPSDACCACGGGDTSPTPFEYKLNQQTLTKGVEVQALPTPQVAWAYEVGASCNLRDFGLALNGKTGHITGKPTRTGDVACDVTAIQDPLTGRRAGFSLRVTVYEFSYGRAFLKFGLEDGEQTPLGDLEFSVSPANKFRNFRRVCTPTVPWLVINAATGKLSYSQADSSEWATGGITGLERMDSGECEVFGTYTNAQGKDEEVSTKILAARYRVWRGMTYRPQVVTVGRPVDPAMIERIPPVGYTEYKDKETGRSYWYKSGRTTGTLVPPAQYPNVLSVDCDRGCFPIKVDFLPTSVWKQRVGPRLEQKVVLSKIERIKGIVITGCASTFKAGVKKSADEAWTAVDGGSVFKPYLNSDGSFTAAFATEVLGKEVGIDQNNICGTIAAVLVCGEPRWSQTTGSLTIGGREAFVLDPVTGDLSGLPQVDFGGWRLASGGRSYAHLTCHIAAGGPWYDKVLTTELKITLQDSICWSPMGCWSEEIDSMTLDGFAADITTAWNKLADAQLKCKNLGSACSGVVQEGSSFTVREGNHGLRQASGSTAWVRYCKYPPSQLAIGNPNMCLQVHRGGVKMMRCKEATDIDIKSQLWFFTGELLRNEFTYECLQSNGDQLSMQQCDTAWLEQAWYQESITGANVVPVLTDANLIRSHDSQKCLDATVLSAVQLQACDKNKNGQLWALRADEEVEEEEPPVLAVKAEPGQACAAQCRGRVDCSRFWREDNDCWLQISSTTEGTPRRVPKGATEHRRLLCGEGMSCLDVSVAATKSASGFY